MSSQFHCIKDLVFHVPSVEDGWIHEDILRERLVRNTIPALKNTQGGPVYAAVAAVNAAGLVELKRLVIVHDSPEERFMADGLLWHVMIHGMGSMA